MGFVENLFLFQTFSAELFKCVLECKKFYKGGIFFLSMASTFLRKRVVPRKGSGKVEDYSLDIPLESEENSNGYDPKKRSLDAENSVYLNPPITSLEEELQKIAMRDYKSD